MFLFQKIQGPETLGNYRPISLCNTVYKIVTKIIVARLRPHLEKLVSPLQSAFVPGRKGVDNAIIVQELIHSISRKKGAVGYMAIKIDLEKAYDKLEWSFIRERLMEINLPTELTDLIMSCVCSVSSSVLFNGGRLDPFFPSRGIRQGDPLSPYLFILCMEYLGHLIEGKCSQKLWNPVRTSQGGLPFSHLMFADDVVLFAKADVGNCVAIRDAPDTFCNRTGQTVSEAKTRVFFSPNVDRDSRESLCDILGFSSTSNLGKYLGIPIKHPGSPLDVSFILDRVKQKLAGWKANLLSPAGHAVLIQASASTIPAYVMQCNLLPNKVLEGIDRVSRNFLWGSSNSARKIHWVGWNKVTIPKKVGGLGLQSAKGRNIALLTKLNWRFHTENESLWARVIKAKYCSSRRINSRNPSSLPCSPTWKGIKKGSEFFRQGSRWVIGRDSNLSFWFDNWTQKGPLRQLVQGPLPRGVAEWKVKDIASVEGWSWDSIPFVIPQDIKMEIQATPYALAASSKDRLMWKDSQSGNFDMKSAYNMAVGVDRLPNFNGGWIWKLNVLPKIQFFLWKCAHNSIGVNECLVGRGMNIDPLCPLCRKEPESIIHALRNCEKVRSVWDELGAVGFDRDFFSSNLEDWMVLNGKSDTTHSKYFPPWKITFCFAVWLIWKNRNQAVFKRRPLNPRLAKSISDYALEFFFCAGPTNGIRNQVTNLVKWVRPECGWMKLNTDGSALGNPGIAGGGGVIRDWAGNWVAGFSRKIGVATSLVAELWAIRDGLMLCIDRRLTMVEVESDAKVVVDMLGDSHYSNIAIAPLLEDCRFLLSQIPQVRIKHCYREANRCADKLARKGANQFLNCVLYENLPVDLCEFVVADHNGISVARQCPGNFVLP